MRALFVIASLCLCCTCTTNYDRHLENTESAERFFRSVYGGDPSALEDLVSDDVVSTYPIFEQLFGTKAIRGKEVLMEFAAGFGNRWKDAQITIHEAVADDNNVVLVWSFEAQRTTTAPDSSVIAGQDYSWGGMSLYQFDELGRIIAEIGEESSPGPMERLEND